MKRLLPAAFLLLFFLLSTYADPMGDDFQWFTGLQWGDVKGLKPVRYIDGYSSDSTNVITPTWGFGFLLEETPGSFRVLMLDFSATEIKKQEFAPGMKYRCEPLDLAAYAQSRLDQEKITDPSRRKYDPAFPPLTPWMGGAKYSPRAELFILAWICSRQGLDDKAAALYKAAQAAPGVQIYEAADDKDWPFRQKLERDLGQFDLWRVMLDFGRPEITRPELYKHLNQLAAEFPHCDYIKRVNDTAGMLKLMIAEDEAHPALTDAQIAKLPPADQAKEWIFRLRDQNGHQNGQPGWVDIFMTDNKDHTAADETSPAHRLVALGDDAVPLLIGELGDKRLTRSVGYGRNFFFSHEVVTTGDAALKIIESIAGREFYRSGRVQGSMAQDKETDEVRAAVEAWWKSHKEKGDKGELADFTAEGHPFSVQAGENLLKKYPAAAATPLLTGAQAAKDWRTRCSLIHLFSTTGDERVKPFLLKEAKEGPFTGSRAQAAFDLARLGSNDGIPPLIDAWENGTPVTAIQDQFQREALVAVLANSDSPEAIAALARGLRDRDARARQTILTALAPGWSSRFLMQLRADPVPGNKSPVLSGSTQAAIESLLAGELDDTNDRIGMNGTSGTMRMRNNRLCDFAACVLAMRWPGRYQFDPGGSYPARERQRVAALNTWRKTQPGLAPLPLPPEPTPVKQEDTGRILRVVTDPAAPALPAALQKILATATGRKLDSALLREIDATIVDKGDSDIPPSAGFAIQAVRGEDNSGFTLLVKPIHARAGTGSRKWTRDSTMNFDNGSTTGELKGILDRIDSAGLSDGWIDIEITYAPPLSTVRRDRGSL